MKKKKKKKYIYIYTHTRAHTHTHTHIQLRACDYWRGHEGKLSQFFRTERLLEGRKYDVHI